MKSVIQGNVGKERTIFCLKAYSVAWKPSCNAYTPAELWRKLRAAGDGGRTHMNHGNMVILADKFPNIDPKPYWIRCFSAWFRKRGETSGDWE